MKFKEKLDSLVKFILNFLQAGWLSFLLAFIFILQNHFFNISLDIFPERYIVRRTATSLALGILIYAPAMLFKKRSKYIYLLISSIMLGFILFCQYLFYTYSGGFLQASALFYAGEGLAILDTVKILLSYKLLVFALGPLFVIAGWYLQKYYKFLEKNLIVKEKIFSAIIIFLMVITGYGYVILREKMESGTAVALYQYNKSYDQNNLVSKIGAVNYSLIDLLVLALREDTVSAADLNMVSSWLDKKTQSPNNTTNKFGIAKGRNLIIIQVESLENVVLNQKINGQEITPYLNQLAKDGIYFNNYYAPIGPGNTADTEFITQTSLYALPNEVAFVNYAYDNYHALPGLLENNGYQTYAFHGDVPSFWNRANIYPSLGYNKIFGRDNYVVSREIGAFVLGDEDFFNQSLPHLKNMPRPFMATLITLTSHTPFALPTDLETLSIPTTSTLNWLQTHYLQSVHYVDQTIGDFINNLKQNDLYDNSVIAIFGDHDSYTDIGKALNVPTLSPFADLNGTQVPLIIFAPGLNLQDTISAPASHLDFYPIIANLLGFAPTTTMFGQDILNTKNPKVIHRNLVSGTIKSIITNNLAYHSAGDGIFEHGQCLKMPSKTPLDTKECFALFEQENENIMISDLMIKGNLFK